MIKETKYNICIQGSCTPDNDKYPRKKWKHKRTRQILEANEMKVPRK